MARIVYGIKTNNNVKKDAKKFVRRAVRRAGKIQAKLSGENLDMKAVFANGRTVTQRIVDERVLEFKRRLILEVGRICCDVQDKAPSGQEWNAYMDSLSVDELKTLCHCFRMELKQVIFAVKEAK
jgi:hypothetical protein